MVEDCFSVAHDDNERTHFQTVDEVEEPKGKLEKNKKIAKKSAGKAEGGQEVREQLPRTFVLYESLYFTWFGMPFSGIFRCIDDVLARRQ